VRIFRSKLAKPSKFAVSDTGWIDPQIASDSLTKILDRSLLRQMWTGTASVSMSHSLSVAICGTRLVVTSRAA
jgi:hypothetical protein